jgi:uncharacterized protein (TIGR02246 family)
MDAIERLLAIEEIKKVKARYFRFIDTGDDEGFLDQFTEDMHWVENDVAGEVKIELHGRAEMAGFLAPMADARASGFSVHHGHTPEIEIIEDRTATGIWAMSDYVRMPGMNIYGRGHYHETYQRCDDGAWRISDCRCTRLNVEMLEPLVEV